MFNLRFFGLLVLLMQTTLYSSVTVAEELFPSTWLEEVKQEAITAGISESTIRSTLQHVRLLPEVIKLDHAQPEFISPFLDYYHQRVDQLKVVQGRERLLRHADLLNQLEAQYGVTQSLLVALWGMETNYGKNQGNVDTFSALATLAYDGRRGGFFRSQLLDAMRMVDAGNATIGQLRGSWAGAFGHMQFMPTTFMTFAVDGDADGRIDVVNSLPDALASAANYLSQVGWSRGELSMLEVRLPVNFDWQNAQIYLRKPSAEWATLGVKALVLDENEHAVNLKKNLDIKKKVKQKRHLNQSIKSGTKKSARKVVPNPLLITVNKGNLPIIKLDDMEGYASILLPQGWQGPAFMIFDNFFAIMDWNRSVNYALSVSQFSKQLNQESRIQGGKNAEAGALSFQQMFELQTMLMQRGYDVGEPDGLPGVQTQAAIRAYQLSQRLPADGYASPSLLGSILATQVLSN